MPTHTLFRDSNAPVVDSALLEITIIDLCPLCDQPLSPRKDDWFRGLPCTKSTTLVDIYKEIWPLTIPDPRDTNEEGRKVDWKKGWELLLKACAQHQYESLILPISVQYEWPRHVDFNRFLRRILAPEIITVARNLYAEPWKCIGMRADVETRPTYRKKTMLPRLIRTLEPVAG